MSEEDRPSPDASERRQLRFALFLQAAACLMFLIAFVARASTSGFDLLTALFGLGLVLTAGAAVFTGRRLKQR